MLKKKRRKIKHINKLKKKTLKVYMTQFFFFFFCCFGSLICIKNYSELKVFLTFCKSLFFAQKYPIFTSKLSQGACSQNVTWFTCVMSVDLTQIKTWRNARRRQWGKVVDTAWLECWIMRAVLIPFTHLAFQCTPFLRFIPSHTFPHRKFITTGVNEKSFLFLILDSCWEELC